MKVFSSGPIFTLPLGFSHGALTTLMTGVKSKTKCLSLITIGKGDKAHCLRVPALLTLCRASFPTYRQCTTQELLGIRSERHICVCFRGTYRSNALNRITV